MRCLRRSQPSCRSSAKKRHSPLAWLTRDHRKAIAIDGQVAFVSGLCVSDRWVGDARRGSEEWRDTGVELRGPSVADVERAFGSAWIAAGGEPIPAEEIAARGAVPSMGEVAVRVVATEPNEAGLFRLDLIVSGLARRTLSLADAYFFATTPYVEALRAAARDGVDVRLLVPGASDLWLVSSVSRAGYRPLLEAGVRVFEWNGPMMHAKTAVADGRWARVGSSNLNVASWLGNYELDVTIETRRRPHGRHFLADRDPEPASAVGASVTREGATARRRRSGDRRRSGSVTPSARRSPGSGRWPGRGAGRGGRRTRRGRWRSPRCSGRLITVPLAALGLWLGAAPLLHAARPARGWRGAEERGTTERSARAQPRDSPDGPGSA
jgi:cardiolipin synthase